VVAIDGQLLVSPKKTGMELTFYDVGGRPVGYCDDGRHIYEFSGLPLAYLEVTRCTPSTASTSAGGIAAGFRSGMRFFQPR